MQINIPGYGGLNIEHIVCDYNGTLASSGIMPEGLKDVINSLARDYKIYVITADTFGTVKEQLSGVNCSLVEIPGADQSQAKLDFIDSIGRDKCAAIGNGHNDSLMLRHAGLGICVIGEEGAFAKSILEADIVCKNVMDALGMLGNPLKIKATMRS